MSDRNRNEFENYISDIILNKDFNKLARENHHGITRYEHSMRVARHTFIISKLLRSHKVKEITRAALLHDFYVDEDLEGLDSKQRLSLHPSIALNNALKYFELNDMQRDIIGNHMFPVTKFSPKHKESWLVSFVDKFVGSYEMLKFKFPMYAGILVIFLMECAAVNN